MNDKWYVLWRRFLRQVFCWHKFTAADPDAIHVVCMKCDWSITNWQAESDRLFNLYAQALGALYKYEHDWKPRRIHLRDSEFPAEQSTDTASTGVE